MRRFSLAIIGRPNVGKSTLFNRLVGKRLALVDDQPGVTRDRREGEGHLGPLQFTVIDTAGLEDAREDSLEGRMRRQTEVALAAADIVLFMIDAREGVTPADEHFAQIARRSARKVIVVANKAEGRAADAGIAEAYALGFGDPVPISAEHGEGMGDLAAALIAALDEHAADAATETPANEPADGTAHAEPAEDASDDPDRPLRLAIVGRPNAGKSTLVNRMLGEERMLTGPEAGITRDTIASAWTWQDRPVMLFDTAGMRRKARVVQKVEKLSVSDALRAIRFAEVVVLLMDAEIPFEKQDLQIAQLVADEGRALVLAINKWDLIDDRTAVLSAVREQAPRLLPQVAGLPVVTLSGLTGEKLDRLMPAVFKAYEAWNGRVPTGPLNRWLGEVQERHPPPAVSGRRIRLRYATQAKSRPPTFVIFASRPEALPDSYRRYLINGIRDTFGLPGTPIRLMFRRGKNPYADRADG